MQTIEPLTLEVSDLSGQKSVRISGVDPDTTIGEVIDGVREPLRMPRSSSQGELMAYHARLDREGRHLRGTERVGEALRNLDRLVLHPEVNAGGGFSLSA